MDNYARDSVADILVCENVENEGFGKIIVDALNIDSGEHGSYFYRLVADDHRLSRGMEDLV